MKIVVTIPTYNEAKTVGSVIRDKKVMRENKFNYKIGVINDGSKDNTKEIIKKSGAIVFSYPINCGLAENYLGLSRLFKKWHL